jgi:nitrite reductase/ring-hydroxylating ferredoxin subunit
VAELAACRLVDLAEAKPTVVVAGERELVLVRWRGDVYALRNVCPHMSTSFQRGAVVGRAGGRVGSPDVDDTDPVVVCPWHGYEFVLASGLCPTDDRLRVRTYSTAVRDGTVYVDLDPRPHPSVSRSGSSPGR